MFKLQGVNIYRLVYNAYSTFSSCLLKTLKPLVSPTSYNRNDRLQNEIPKSSDLSAISDENYSCFQIWEYST